MFLDIGDCVIEEMIREFGKNIRIAFMPYKREMWSCMQSVYEAGSRRHDVTCAVFPIPWRTKNETGGYHRDYFSEYKGKTIEEFNPDVCVIHYPYDTGNKLTEIHPDYTAMRLNFMEYKIVYIPYYGYGCGNTVAKQPGTMLADMIILDREEHKQSYLNAGIPEEVLCVTGCPKRDLLDQKPEVILLTTSLIPFMNHFFSEASDIKRIVEGEYCQGSQIIYRPHPLLDDGMREMVSSMYDSYKAFNEWMSQFCLIDRAGSLERSMMIADRLICDGGSVVDEWNCLPEGKPVAMISDEVYKWL